MDMSYKYIYTYDLLGFEYQEEFKHYSNCKNKKHHEINKMKLLFKYDFDFDSVHDPQYLFNIPCSVWMIQ